MPIKTSYNLTARWERRKSLPSPLALLSTLDPWCRSAEGYNSLSSDVYALGGSVGHVYTEWFGDPVLWSYSVSIAGFIFRNGNDFKEIPEGEKVSEDSRGEGACTMGSKVRFVGCWNGGIMVWWKVMEKTPSPTRLGNNNTTGLHLLREHF